MEIRTQSHRWEQRTPDWLAAGVAGFAAGAILMVLELVWSATRVGGNPWSTPHMIAAIVLGRDALQSTDFNVGIVATALAVHYLLGIILGLILGAIIAPFRFDSSMALSLLVGAVFGLAIYLINFYGLERVFPWFANMRGWAAVVAHLIFGMSAAAIYDALERPAHAS
ncbi:MAG TPA: hypothetical protein VJ698_07595 [Noviherbaspirillum sp.]|uniref:hypothetical protein n=1 Tax=Noviherbaspirillum sp. TaxID=1926288 RepID=UPI002B48653D|nr:hypothetical protein [Noviherbaspirillum sp.]HJV85326.1 hypothetical protein [Noviherbaspirillum sp.]